MKRLFRSFVLAGIILTIIAASGVPLSAQAQAPAKRPLAADDVFRILEVADPQLSPEGEWIAYTVTSMDREADELRTAIWMVDWKGTESRRLTYGSDSDSSPRWSPDGRYLAFLSARPADAKTQVWVLDRRGGEARPLTNVKGKIGSFEWSPDGKRLALVMKDGDETPDADRDGKAKTPKPIVIDRYLFKADYEGYLTGPARDRLYLFEVETGKLEALTGDKTFDEGNPAWSPDGSKIAFVSNHAKDPDRVQTQEIFISEARAGAAARKLITIARPDSQRLVWSPDGATLAFVQGFESQFNFYNQDRLAVVPAAGGEPRILTDKLDRRISQAEFTADGSALTFLVEDDRRAYLGRIAVRGGDVERLSGSDAVPSVIVSRGGRTVVAAATDSSATEIYALENGKFRRLTKHNDALLAEIQLGAVEDTSFRSKDGTEIHGLMVKPPAYEPGKRYPTILWIHGGPCMQDDHALLFDTYPLQLERQLFAANGYVVLAVNYRGSSGRGAAFARSIVADWGNREVADLQAAVDDAVSRGIADPGRLGVGGWSYGGISTDYLIASDTRFKAAISGAGSASPFLLYGVDQYILQYSNELGPPWLKTDLYVKLSYPFLHADRIKTPTLFMGGEKDLNVPIVGGEQMYQALRALGVPTELVIYPGQYHILSKPSYIRERLGRFLAWFGKYLKTSK